jgi:hypothetical protein
MTPSLPTSEVGLLLLMREIAGKKKEAEPPKRGGMF